MTTILVTGGAGFIGQHVADELWAQEFEPVIFSNRHPLDLYDCRLGDIRDETSVMEAVAHVNGVIHLAGVLGTQETVKHPRAAAETNILGGLNVLNACAANDVPLVNIAVGNYFENNTYSISKHTVERFMHMYCNHNGLTAASVRVMNAYGPGQSIAKPYGDSNVRKIFPSFAARAIHGDPIEIYGDGNQIMDMVFVSDVASALVYVMDELLAGHLEFNNQVLTCGTGRDITVNEIANIIVDEAEYHTGKRSEIKHLPMRPGETPGVVVKADVHDSNFLAMDYVPFEEGAYETVGYFVEHFNRKSNK